jgi:cytochrome c5
MKVLLLPLAIVLLSACSPTPQMSDKETGILEAAFSDTTMTEAVMEKWARSCALCHVAGEGGAPKIGDTDAWKDRTAKGPVQLLYNTLHGINRMPPLGYCMDCESSDFAAMIHFMTGDNQ